jgi:predicted aldo/keto reductase-like oxidoreductase
MRIPLSGTSSSDKTDGKRVIHDFRTLRACPSYQQHPIMTWGTVKLSDGRHIPGVGFGSSHHPGEDIVTIIDTAIEAGFDHIDTAQGMS